MFKLLHLPTGYITYNVINHPRNYYLNKSLSNLTVLSDIFNSTFLERDILPKHMYNYTPYNWDEISATIYVECNTHLQARQLMHKLCKYRKYTKEEFEIHEY